MALEPQVVEGSPSKNFPDNLRGGEAAPDFGILKSIPGKTTRNKSTIPKHKGGCGASSGNKAPDYSSSIGGRSISDLPPALVSEILRCLDAKELGIVSCVSHLFLALASDHQNWKDFYCKRWCPPPDLNSLQSQTSWKEFFVERERRSKSFAGRFSTEALRGHTEAVRAVFILQPASIIFTGGYDSVIRMWDLEEGLSIAVSLPLGCTVRAIAADTELLVAGGTDAFLQCWRAVKGHPHLFDITGSMENQDSDFRLWGHVGPVTCLALDASRIYSGSWDMNIRVWDRAQLKCLRTLRHGDWVWALAPSGRTIASTAGKDVYVWDIDHGNLITVINNAHTGNAQSLARSRSGDLLFTGGEDGAVHMFAISDGCDGEHIKPSATWVPHTGPVLSLAFEFPWLVSSSSDGRIALINVRKLLSSVHCSSFGQGRMVNQFASGSVEAPQRMLHGFGCDLFSVDIGSDRIVCGGEEGVVRVWNFSEALEIENRVQASRSFRLENRMRRRKAQIAKNVSNGQADQCSVAAQRNQLSINWNATLQTKRRMSGKLKA